MEFRGHPQASVYAWWQQNGNITRLLRMMMLVRKEPSKTKIIDNVQPISLLTRRVKHFDQCISNEVNSGRWQPFWGGQTCGITVRMTANKLHIIPCMFRAVGKLSDRVSHLDMSKAFYRSWNRYLVTVHGLGPTFCEWITTFIEASSLSYNWSLLLGHVQS